MMVYTNVDEIFGGKLSYSYSLSVANDGISWMLVINGRLQFGLSEWEKRLEGRDGKFVYVHVFYSTVSSG